MPILNYVRDLSLSVKKRGLLGTARLIVPELAFDWRYGTDTLRLVSAEDLLPELEHVAPEHRQAGHGYQGISSWLWKRTISVLSQKYGLRPSDHHFVDIGSGKGRGLLLAAQSGFKSALGVEYSGSLARIAHQNAARYAEATDCKTPIQTLEIDASKFEPGQEVSFFFFFNPFSPPLLDLVVQRMAQARPHAWFLYMNPLYPRSFESAGLSPVEVLKLTSPNHIDGIAYRR